MINKIIEITNSYLEKEDFTYDTMVQFISEVHPIVQIDNIYVILINTENGENIKRIDFVDNQILFPDKNLDKSTVLQFSSEVLSYDEMFALFHKKKKKTNKMMILNTVQDRMKFLAFFDLNAKSHIFFKKNHSTINLLYSSLILKHLSKLQSSTTNPFNGISFPLLIDEMQYNIIISNTKDDIVFCNRSAQISFGVDVINKSINTLFSEDNCVTDNRENELNSEGNNVYYFPNKNKYYEVNSQKISYANNQSYNVYMAFDVTRNELNKIEIKKKQEIIDLQLLALDEFAMIDIRSESGDPIYNNKRDFFEKENEHLLMKISPEEYSKLSPETIVDITKTISERKVWRGTIKLQFDSENYLWLNSVIVPLHTDEGFRIVSISINISKEKAQQEEIAKLASAVEFSPISTIITNNKGDIEFINSKFIEKSGLSKEEVLGKNFNQLGNGYVQDEIWSEILSVVSNRNSWEGVVSKKSASGEDVWESTSVSSIINEKGEITNLVVIIEDVTDKINLQRQITQTNTLLETINETTSEGIIVFDRDGSIIMKNNKFLELTNLVYDHIRLLKEEEIFSLLESSVLNIMRYEEIIDDIFSSRESKVQTTIDLINNRFYELNVMPFVQDNEIIGRMWTLRDISDRADYEEKLKRTNYKLEKAVAISDEQARKLEINVKELEETRLLMEKAANIKSEFIANISHEIRTPLNSIIGYADILVEENLTSKQRKFLLSIINSGKNLLLLINDILEISKFDTIENQKTNKPIFIEKFINGIYQMFLDKVNPALVNYRISIDENLPPAIFLDEVRLRQILINLIGNAVKFTSAGDIEVKFTLLKADKYSNTIDINISIIDTGIGIPNDYIEAIFEPFYQITGVDSKKYKGSGIGLTLVKKLVDLMGGEIKVTSKLQVGSTFNITFRGLSVYNSSTPLINGEYGDTFIENVLFSPANILVCDDILVNITLVKSMLRNQNVQVIGANSGKEAIEIFRKEKIDLILMDYSMEDMNGDVATQIIKNEINKNIKVILLSAASCDAKLYDESIFDGSLDKPFSKEELFECLKQYLNYEENIVPEFTNQSLIDEQQKIYINISKEDIVISKLSQNEILEHCKHWGMISASRTLNEIKKFAEDLHNFSNQNNLESFKYYAETLKNYIRNYDIENMNAFLKYFPDFVLQHNINISEN